MKFTSMKNDQPTKDYRQASGFDNRNGGHSDDKTPSKPTNGEDKKGQHGQKASKGNAM